jgi:hypothetical protein
MSTDINLDWKARAEAAEKLLKSVASDISSMESSECAEFDDGEKETLLGSFSVGRQDLDDGSFYVSWPNILILRDQIITHLKQHNEH